MATTNAERGTWALASDVLATTYGITGWHTKGRDVRRYSSGLFRFTWTRGTSGMTSLTFRLLSADVSEKDTVASHKPLTEFPAGGGAGVDVEFQLDPSADFVRDVKLEPNALQAIAVLALQCKGSHVKGDSVLTVQFLGTGEHPRNQTENVA